MPGATKITTVIAIVGPTCTGKTGLGLRLAHEFKSEIIACDSRTIYKYMDIGTAKPTRKEREQTPHHLLDIVEPDNHYSVAQYKNDAEPILDRLAHGGSIPIVVGGTGFYFRNLLEGLAIPMVPPQNSLRADLNKFADINGNQALHEKLSKIDAPAAAKIGINDRFRIIRALEITAVLGRPYSEAVGRQPCKYHTIWIALYAADRKKLVDAMRIRLQEQINNGLIEEVESLLARFGRCRTLTNTIAYAEIISYLDGKISLSEAIDLCLTHTAQFARRQLIWFRSNKNLHWLAIDEMSQDEIAERALNLAQSCLQQSRNGPP